MEVQVIANQEGLCAIAQEWMELWNRLPCATPFESPLWLIPWFRHLYGGGKLWTLALRREKRLVAIAPLFTYGRPGEPRTAVFGGSGVSDYCDILAERQEDLQVLCSYIADAEMEWDTVDLSEIATGSRLLSASFGAVQVEYSVSNLCPRVRLPDTMVRFEQSLSAKFRRNLRNSRNRLERLGVTHEVSDHASDVEFIEALFKLHSSRWKLRGEEGVLNTPRLRSFFREVCAGFRTQGWLRLHGLRDKAALEAITCIFSAHRNCYFYISGFSERLGRYSPGSVLIAHAIELAIEEGATHFDFLRQTEAYKFNWGAVSSANARIILRR